MTKTNKIPSHLIEKWVKNNFDCKERKNGNELVIANPFYGNDKKLFNINIENGYCHDWRSDEWAGPINPKTGKRPCHIVRFVQLYRGCSYQEAVNELLAGTGLVYEQYREQQPQEQVIPYSDIKVPDGFRPLTEPTDFFSTRAWKYLIRRGYTPEDILKENIHYSCSDVLWLYTELSELVYLQSRSLSSKSFWFPPNETYDKDGNLQSKLEITKEEVLYGFDFIPKCNYLVLVESIFNRISLGVFALATCGAQMTSKQIPRLKFINPQNGIILAPDNDKAGLQSVVNNAKLLGDIGYPLYYSIPPKLEYVEDGVKKHIKDWNELYTHLKFTKEQILDTFNQNILPVTGENLLKLNTTILGLNDGGNKFFRTTAKGYGRKVD